MDGTAAADAPDLATPLIAWFRAEARDLPWRRPGFPAWGTLVSEIMLQQTQVARVVPRLEAWLTRWPTPRDLAQSPPSDAVRAWDRLGYPRRALALHAAATAIAEQHDNVVPRDVDALLALPGIGDYTARPSRSSRTVTGTRSSTSTSDGCSHGRCSARVSPVPRRRSTTSRSWSPCCRRTATTLRPPTPR